jgi:hypothetical protein
MIVVLRWAPLGIVGYAVQLQRPGWVPRGVWIRATGRLSGRGQGVSE